MIPKRAAFAGRISRPAKLRLDRHAAADIAISCRRRIRKFRCASCDSSIVLHDAHLAVRLQHRDLVQSEFPLHAINVFPLSRGEAGTSRASQAYWQVDDIEREVAELKKPGIVFEDYDMPAIKTDSGIYAHGGRKVFQRLVSHGRSGVARLTLGHVRGPCELAHVRRLDHGRAP